MSLWDVSDYTRLRTGGDDDALAGFAGRLELRGKRVLDVGCGPGLAAAALATRYGAVVTGIDGSPAMLAAARAGGVDAVEGRAEALPFADRSFDVAIAGYVVHLLDRPAAFAELHRVLTEDGVLWVKTADPRTLREHWMAPFFPSFVELEAARFPGPDELRVDLERAGFREIEFEILELRRELSRAGALEVLRGGAYSTMRLLPADELATGIELAERTLDDPVRSSMLHLTATAVA